MVKIIKYSLLIILFVFSVVVYRVFGVDHDCNNLNEIADNESLQNKLFSSLAYELDKLPTLSGPSKKVGVIFVRDVDGALGINWEDIKIPMNAPPAKSRWFRVTAESRSFRLKAIYNTLKSSSGSFGFWFSMYAFQTSSVTFPLEATQ